jgi:hypothetical protein
MEDRPPRRMRTLVTQMASLRPDRQRDRTRTDIHDGPEQRSNERPDTLMQDPSPTRSTKIPLQRAAGPYIWIINGPVVRQNERNLLVPCFMALARGLLSGQQQQQAAQLPDFDQPGGP